MVDVFISYSQADRPHVEKLEAELNAHGYSTWWDKKLERGDDFSKTIDRHLKDAKIVICLWSETSVESDWVRAEAEKARSLGKLLGVQLGSVLSLQSGTQMGISRACSWEQSMDLP